jgi:threonyl-tRNA synthetase
VDNGFYYEMALPDGAAVHAHDWAPLESIVSKIVKEKQPFQRLVRWRGTAASGGPVLLLLRTI